MIFLVWLRHDGPVDLTAVEELREDLDAFCAEVFAAIPRKDSRG